MRKLGTVDLEILSLAIKEKGTFNENNLENSDLKRYGVGKILDALASLKDRKFISLNSDGSFTITELAREILWNSKIPIWAKILRLLQIKSCNQNQIIEILGIDEDEIDQKVAKEAITSVLLLLAPIVPHICNRLWLDLGFDQPIIDEVWPMHNPHLMMADTLEIIVQVNGKLRSKITVDSSIENAELEQLVLMDEKIKKYTNDQTIKKIIIVPKKLVNIVI